MTQLSLSERLLVAGSAFETSVYSVRTENGEIRVEEICKLSGIRFDHIEAVEDLLYFRTDRTLHYYDAERRQIVIVSPDVKRFLKTTLDEAEVVLI